MRTVTYRTKLGNVTTDYAIAKSEGIKETILITRDLESEKVKKARRTRRLTVAIQMGWV